MYNKNFELFRKTKMDFQKNINKLKAAREVILSSIDGLNSDQLLNIPIGFNNNILWNLGHIITTQQSLHYFLSGEPMHISKELLTTFRTGTSPADWQETPNISQLKSLLIDLPYKLEEDFKWGKFQKYRAFKTSTGFTINDFEESLIFNLFHEGVHAGIILSLKKIID